LYLQQNLKIGDPKIGGFMVAVRIVSMALVMMLCLCILAQSEVGVWTFCDARGPLPAARYSHTAINDLAHNRMIIYGGYSAVHQYRYGDIWALSGDSLVWSQLYANNDGPFTIMAHAAMYDDIDTAMVVFGGLIDGELTNDVWILNLNTMTWDNVLHSDPWPSPRMCLYATSGPAPHQMLIFGGRSYGDWFNDTWLFNLSDRTWEQMQYPDSVPTPREGVPEVYINNSNMLLYGGWSQNHGYYDEAWTLDLVNGIWAQQEPPDPHPTPRNYNTVLFDIKRDIVLIWGGFCGHSGPGLNDLWKLDLPTMTYEQLDEQGDVPSPRGRHSTIKGHFAGHRATIFGGANLFQVEFNTTYFLDWQTPTDIEEEQQLPDKFGLLDNYPNPFNANTTLRYSLDKPGAVIISIYDLLGKKVATLFEGHQISGDHSLTWDARAFPSGIYFARLTAGSQSEDRKIILLK
jgi:hypothetical protein